MSRGDTQPAPPQAPASAMAQSNVAPPEARAPDLQLGVASAAYGLLAPLFLRIRTGEGALLGIAASLLWFSGAAPLPAVVDMACCLLVMVQMYAHNDMTDARADLDNPRKDARLSKLLVGHAGFFHGASAALALLSALLTTAAMGPRSGVFALAVMACNAAYSRWFKPVPVLDFVAVGVWGGLFAGMLTDRPQLVLGVVLMTASSHVFQTLLDRKVDRRAGILTTGARSVPLSLACISGLSIALTSWAWPITGPAIALCGLGPMAAALAVRGPAAAWLVAKAAFAVVWLSVLLQLRGH